MQRAGDLGEIEHVQRPAAIEGEVIGDVDERVDRAQADRAQALLHPLRRRAVLDAAHQAQREGGAEARVVGGEIERDGGRAVEASGDGRRRLRLQRPQARRGEVARDSRDARRVGAVGREIDVDDGIVEAGVGRIGPPDRRVVGQVDDAVVIVGQLQFGGRTQHAVRIRRRG